MTDIAVINVSKYRPYMTMDPMSFENGRFAIPRFKGSWREVLFQKSMDI